MIWGGEGGVDPFSNLKGTIRERRRGFPFLALSFYTHCSSSPHPGPHHLILGLATKEALPP